MNAEELAARIREGFSDVFLARDEVIVVVGRDELVDALVRLRDQSDLSFRFLSSITATDHPAREPRFWVVYELRSVEHSHRHIKGKQHGFGFIAKSCPLIPVNQCSAYSIVVAGIARVGCQPGKHVLGVLGILLSKNSSNGNK